MNPTKAGNVYEPIASENIKKITWQRRIALEWLYLLAAVAIGLTVLPATVMLVGTHELRFGLFYKAIANGNDYARWVVLAPYILLQLVRSTLWALRAAKN
jgi:hypothetical protein